MINSFNKLGFAFCLNLKRRVDRRLKCRDQFKRFGIEVSFIEALDSLGVVSERSWRNKGSRCCSIGHQLAWRQAWRHSEFTLIFEDDVILCDDFKDRLKNLILPADWAICYLGCVFREPPILVRPGLLRVGQSFDMHAYLIRKPFARMLGRALRKPSQRSLDGPIPPEKRTAIDVILSDQHETHAAYAVWPPMAWQAEGLSNIEHSYRGNYHPDGRQRIYEGAIARLPWPYDPLADGNALESNPVKDGPVEAVSMSANLQ